jgi:carbonic anhydrase/acetyltransferase-like protein (isoleucine patch superfamily)
MKQRFKGMMPEFQGKYYIHSTACVIGNVNCKECVSVWPNAVIRGDLDRIDIGSYVNVQDNATLHVGTNQSLRIGSNVIIGHGAVVHACEIGDNTLVGVGAIILNGAVIGNNCIIGAGTLISHHKFIEDNSIVIGNPYVITRKVTAEEIEDIKQRAKHYWQMALDYIKSAETY